MASMKKLLCMLLFVFAFPSGAFADGPAKNVILLIGDGMGFGQIEIARQLEYGKQGQLHMEKLDHSAMMHTYSASDFVTDSAAAGTAIATGIKTNNGAIGVDADGKEVDSILDSFQKNGKRVGLISKNMIVDATPAAFGASVQNRWTGTAQIAKQYLDNNIDVILGGGSTYFSNLLPQFHEKGYSILTNKNELRAAKNHRLLGLFAPKHMNFVIDKQQEEPSLPEMAAAALEALNNKEGFFLMIEGARIDHAAHAADITSVWRETIEFDQTVKTAQDWAANRNDTLIIVLADHETMGLSATGVMDIAALKKITVSTAFIAKQLEGKKVTPKEVMKVLKKYTNISLTYEEAKQFIKHIHQKRGLMYPENRVDWEIGSVIALHYKAGVADRTIRLGNSTGGHTANMVPIFAAGPGSEAFTGVLNNTDIAQIISKAAFKK